MSRQVTLVIVKPDGVSKGLTSAILKRASELGLVVTKRAITRLSREWVEELYQGEKGKPYFELIVQWVSSAPVRLLRIEGTDAVSRMKWEAIGRYPNGIRGLYSESFIRNVAHASDSVASAIRELRLAEPIFQGELERMTDRLAGRTIFALTGMSECGKSTAGMHFDSSGIPRLKIKHIFDRLRSRESPDEDLPTYVAEQEARDKLALWDRFIDELLREMDALEVRAVSIESLYGDEFARHLKYRLGVAFCLVFIDIPLEVRVDRQMGRQGIDDPEVARKMLVERDKVKADSGIEKIRGFADEVLDNSGTIQSFRSELDRLVEEYVQD